MLLTTFMLVLAPNASAQGAYQWGNWTSGPASSQPQFIWNGGNSYTAKSPTTLSATWTNGYHSATVTTTQPAGFAMVLDPDSVWGASDNGPQPPKGVYVQSASLGGLIPNIAVQSFAILGGISSDMVMGFYGVIPASIKLEAYDTNGAPVSLAGVYSAFQNITDYTGNNPLTLNADGTFSGSLTPIPGGTIDSAFAGFAGFDPSIVKIDVITTRSAPGGGVGSWGDGYSIYLGSIAPPAPIPTLTGWGQLMLGFLLKCLAGWTWKRRAFH